MTRTDQIWTTAAFAFVGGLMAVFMAQSLSGCAKGDHSLMPYARESAAASARTDVRAEQIVTDADKVKPRTDAVGKVHVERIKDNATHIKADVVVQQDASEKAQQAYAGVTKELETERTAHVRTISGYESRWYVRIGKVVDRVIKLAWWLFALLIGGGFLLRIGGMFAGGWIGATMAKVGSIGLHMLPIVGGVVNQFFDNAFFRQRQFALEAPKPSPPVGVVVEQPLDPEGDVTAVGEPMAARTVAVKRTAKRRR